MTENKKDFKTDFATTFKDSNSEDIIETESNLLNKVRLHFSKNFIKDNLKDVYDVEKFKQDFFHKIFVFILDYLLGKPAMILYFISFILYLLYLAFIYFYGIQNLCLKIEGIQLDNLPAKCFIHSHLENFKSSFGYLITLLLGGVLTRAKINEEKIKD